jgi:hypothetical protein
MSKDNVLKKQFQQKDVQRLRNLVQGKYGDKSSVSSGYTKLQEFHIEGDIWEEDGRQWTIKNGIKQNITKLDKARKTVHFPLFCPTCKKAMKPHLDKKWYSMYKRCFNCQVDFEHEIRKQGLWEEYEKTIFNSDIDGIMNTFQIWIDDEIQNESNLGFVTEAGDVEKWVGSGKSKMLETKEEAIKYLQSLKKQ